MRLDVAGDSTLPGSDQLGLMYRQILASHSPVIEEQGWGSRGRYGRGQGWRLGSISGIGLMKRIGKSRVPGCWTWLWN